jgi:hypothetical protein
MQPFLSDLHMVAMFVCVWSLILVIGMLVNQ